VFHIEKFNIICVVTFWVLHTIYITL
jgi:hypothetical protein